MSNKALVVIDIQNDITKHYRDIIDNINSAIDWAMKQGMAIIYWAMKQGMAIIYHVSVEDSRLCRRRDECDLLT